MKYIRTKAKIYEVESKFLDNEGKWVGYNIVGNDMALILRIQVIKQADTIEELCDGYVFVSKSGETHYVYFKLYDMGVCLGSRIENDEIFRNHLLENGTIYGAIWTDKGLIYVAKMNDKGKLKLL